MITDAELDDMRVDAEASLTDTGMVYSPSKSSDSAGGQTEGTPVSHGPYACRVEQSNRYTNEMPIVAGGVSPRKYNHIVFPHDAIVEQGDTIVVGTSEYTVDSVPERTFDILLRVRCIEVVDS